MEQALDTLELDGCQEAMLAYEEQRAAVYLSKRPPPPPPPQQPPADPDTDLEPPGSERQAPEDLLLLSSPLPITVNEEGEEVGEEVGVVSMSLPPVDTEVALALVSAKLEGGESGKMGGGGDGGGGGAGGGEVSALPLAEASNPVGRLIETDQDQNQNQDQDKDKDKEGLDEKTKEDNKDENPSDPLSLRPYQLGRTDFLLYAFSTKTTFRDANGPWQAFVGVKVGYYPLTLVLVP